MKKISLLETITKLVLKKKNVKTYKINKKLLKTIIEKLQETGNCDYQRITKTL